MPPDDFDRYCDENDLSDAERVACASYLAFIRTKAILDWLFGYMMRYVKPDTKRAEVGDGE